MGHSLGSVVAYEVAQQIAHPLPLLITLGSPLGLEEIIFPRLRPQPPGFPPLVQRWVNVADRDDVVAAEPNLASLFGKGAHRDAVFDGGYTVENGAEPHSVLFYLRAQETGRPVGQVMSMPA
jgi:hypothetical protein